MKVQVKGYLNLRDVIGDQPVRLVAEGTTVRELLEQLAPELGDEVAQMVASLDAGRNHPPVAILVNGRHGSHLPAGLDTVLQDGDQVAIFPPTAGG